MKHPTLKLLSAIVFLAALTAGAAANDGVNTLQSGKAKLESAGALAFGPAGVLFVGDSQAAKIYALDTGDREPGSGKVSVTGINEKIAAQLGTAPDQILIQDLAVNSISRKVYLSVSRGRAGRDSCHPAGRCAGETRGAISRQYQAFQCGHGRCSRPG
jgi:hypothetical protein